MVTHRQNYPFTIITVGMGRSPQYHSPVVDARRANGAIFLFPLLEFRTSLNYSGLLKFHWMAACPYLR